MSTETHLQDVRTRLMTVELLRTAKKRYTYRELSMKTGLPITVLSRYVKGHVLPTTKRAKMIWGTLDVMISLQEELRNRVKFDELGYFDNTSIVCDLPLLQQAAQYILRKFAGKRITRVITAAVDGVPLSTIIAGAISVDLVIAKRTKEVGVREFVEETYIPSDSGMIMAYYIPRGSIKKGDSVLIVDDVIRSGETQRALVNLIRKARADVAGIFALVSVGKEWKRKFMDIPEFPVEIILEVGSPTQR
jgi:purine operon repressor